MVDLRSRLQKNAGAEFISEGTSDALASTVCTSTGVLMPFRRLLGLIERPYCSDGQNTILTMMTMTTFRPPVSRVETF